MRFKYCHRFAYQRLGNIEIDTYAKLDPNIQKDSRVTKFH